MHRDHQIISMQTGASWEEPGQQEPMWLLLNEGVSVGCVQH